MLPPWQITTPSTPPSGIRSFARRSNDVFLRFTVASSGCRTWSRYRVNCVLPSSRLGRLWGSARIVVWSLSG